MSKLVKAILICMLAGTICAVLIDPSTEPYSIETIEQQVADDAVKQYQIATKSPDKLDDYVQAGLVAAAYLQANDSVNYLKWKDIEGLEADTAGLNFEQP